MGYHQAGFEVVGVDISPQPHYPFVCHQGDAMVWPLDGFDVIHASPPCHAHSALGSFRTGHGTAWMLSATRDRLERSGLPWIIENVERAAMPDALVLCGASFGCETDGYVLRRHRRFASSEPLTAPPCACRGRRILGVYGHGGGTKSNAKGVSANAAEARALMGIDWMTRREMSQAIPPAYTEHLGRQLLVGHE
jgi:DNA (cytosine-5)-methyltransferase 1